jgi:two-component system sensor kinase FixL
MISPTPDQLEDLIEEMHTGFVLLDADYRVRDMNPSGEEIGRTSRFMIVDKLCWDVWPGLCDTELGIAILQAMTERTSQAIDARPVTISDRTVWLEFRIQPWLDGVAIFFRDVSEPILTEAALQATQQAYRLAARVTQDVLWDWDVATDEIRWNEAAADLLGGMSLLHTTREWWRNHLHPDDRRRVMDGLDKALKGADTFLSQEYRLQAEGGRFALVYDRTCIMRDEKGKAVRAIGALIDLSEQRKAEQQVEQLQSELIHLARVGAMGEVAAKLADEVGQPLAAIHCYISSCERLLRMGGKEDLDRLGEGLADARKATRQVENLIASARRMMRPAEAIKTVTNLRRAVDEAVRLATLGVPDPNLKIQVLVSHDLEVMANEVQLTQVLLNLVRNALEAMAGQTRQRLSIIGWRDGRKVRVDLKDTGPGIADNVRPLLFTPMQSSKSGAAGMGLSISRTVMEAHGGHIWAEDGVGGGTTICLDLPASEPASVDEALSDGVAA